MRRDYHMHPTVITNPERTDDFVRQALSLGIGEICLTDHMPLRISKASDRLPHGTVKEYCRRVREAAKRYEGILTIRCGIEIDYHPSARDEIEAVLDEGDFDYVLGSSHLHVFVRDMERYTYNDFAEMALENSVRAAETGWFDTISHPDMFRFAFRNAKRFPLVDDGYDPRLHRASFEALFEAVKKQGMRLEINPHLAESTGDPSLVYPEPVVTEWALEAGVAFAYGSDAHRSESVGAMLDVLEAHSVYGAALKQWEEA